MSLLDRLFHSSRSRIYDEGLILFEQGRFAEAVELLRTAVEAGQKGRADSLGGNLLRRALVSEGRRLLRAGQAEAAGSYFKEACDLWPRYPDLQWWHGTSLGLSGDWNEALLAARNALRINPEYPEARLLEAAALSRLGRAQEAATALNTLRESGRRNDHWLPQHWQDAPAFTADQVPEDLPELLGKVVQGESEKEKLSAAVALCRAGDWEQGVLIFRDLVARRPAYPDYRTRLSAALFQMRRVDEALREVEAALVLQPGYTSALDLKVLILADLQRFQEAWDFLSVADKERKGQNPGSLEALFGAYLRGVLALLLGRPAQAVELLEWWSDLGHDFAWAELLAAAADYLRGRSKSCGLRLTGLAREWPGDPEYSYLLACFHLEQGNLDQVAEVLDNWPRDDSPDPDQRPLFLLARLAVAKGSVPDFPQNPSPAGANLTVAGVEVIPRVLPAEAWQMLRAEEALIKGEHGVCWRICRDLERQGYLSERSLEIMLQCLDAEEIDESWQPPSVVPDSCLTGICAHALQHRRPDQTKDLLQTMTHLHPERLQVMFLKPEFWLKSVRRWLS